jgi:hypothetical protein
MLEDMLNALPRAPDAAPAQTHGRHSTAIALIAELAPRSLLEASLSVRFVTAHFFVTECFRRASLPDMPVNFVLNFHGKAAALSRMMTTTLSELQERQFAAKMRTAAEREAGAAAPPAGAAAAGSSVAEQLAAVCAAAKVKPPAGTPDPQQAAAQPASRQPAPPPERQHPMPSGAMASGATASGAAASGAAAGCAPAPRNGDAIRVPPAAPTRVLDAVLSRVVDEFMGMVGAVTASPAAPAFAR